MQMLPSFRRRSPVFGGVASWAGLLLGGAVLAANTTAATPREVRRLNVVLIVMDDLNDYVTGLGGHPQARTPHLARLAGEGVSFRRAYSNIPICAPSRSSLFSGLYPHTTGLIHFGKWFENETIINSKLIPEYFRENGYRTLGTGKLLHHYRPNVWEEHGFWPNYGPFAYDGKKMVGHPSVPEPFRSIGGVDGSFAPLSDVPSVPRSTDAPGYTGWMDHPRWNQWKPLRYVSEDDRDPLPDERCARWAVNKIHALSAQPDGRPFLLGVGFIRPHTPMVAPKRFFDMFPRKNIQLPVIKDGDAADTHYRKLFNPDVKGLRYYRLLKESYPSLKEGLQAYLQAYLACVAFADEQAGKVIEAVDQSPFRDNTIIVVTSDHGYQMGQKDYIFKNSLWEESTRIPLIIRAPGIAKRGAVVDHPVALIDIYPTLVDLCGLKGDTRKNAKGAPLDGFSLRPLLEHPEGNQWAGPDAALTVIKAEGRLPEKVHQHHYSVRTQRWRYVLYNDGSEELYDHDADPYEWNNLADNPRHQAMQAKLRAQLFRMTGRRPK